jgi:hypothetical protein
MQKNQSSQDKTLILNMRSAKNWKTACSENYSRCEKRKLMINQVWEMQPFKMFKIGHNDGLTDVKGQTHMQEIVNVKWLEKQTWKKSWNFGWSK